MCLLLLGGKGRSQNQDDGADEEKGANGAGVATKVTLGGQHLRELRQEGGGLLSHDFGGGHGQSHGTGGHAGCHDGAAECSRDGQDGEQGKDDALGEHRVCFACLRIP